MSEQTGPPEDDNPWTAPPPGATPASPPWSPQAYPAPQFGAPQGLALPPGVVVSSPGRRFGAYLLDFVLVIVTLVIGYLIWTLAFTWGRGQTPAKSLLKMRVVNVADGRAATWGKMALRDFLLKGILFGLIGIVWLIAAAFVFSDTRQALWDRMVGTVVVDDPNAVLAPA